MQSFDEKKAGLTAFVVKTQGFDKGAAEKAAIDMMYKLPAWKAYF
jgi:hypothetical protein